jgi:hypothetical protein
MCASLVPCRLNPIGKRWVTAESGKGVGEDIRTGTPLYATLGDPARCHGSFIPVAADDFHRLDDVSF